MKGPRRNKAERPAPRVYGVGSFDVRAADVLWVGDPLHANHPVSDLRVKYPWAREHERRIGGEVMLAHVLSGLKPGTWKALVRDGEGGRPAQLSLYNADHGGGANARLDIHLCIDSATITVGQRRKRTWVQAPSRLPDDGGLRLLTGWGDGCYQGVVCRCPDTDEVVGFIVTFLTEDGSWAGCTKAPEAAPPSRPKLLH